METKFIKLLKKLGSLRKIVLPTMKKLLQIFANITESKPSSKNMVQIHNLRSIIDILKMWKSDSKK